MFVCNYKTVKDTPPPTIPPLAFNNGYKKIAHVLKSSAFTRAFSDLLTFTLDSARYKCFARFLLWKEDGKVKLLEGDSISAWQDEETSGDRSHTSA